MTAAPTVIKTLKKEFVMIFIKTEFAPNIFIAQTRVYGNEV